MAMIPILLAALLAFPLPPMIPTLGSGTPTPVISKMETTQLPASGLATFYSAGVFERVVKNQIANGSIQPDACPQCVGWAAMLWPGDVGRVVCVEGLRLWVVDVAAAHHRAGLQRRGWVIDIDRASWLALGQLDTPTLTTVEEC